MAREEHAREDLLAEAVALVERIEFVHPDCDEHVVVGFRADGAPSFYFGEDPVYQLNAVGELRRAFCDGLMIKAKQGRLTSLERRRTEQQVQLLSRELKEGETQRLLDDFANRAKALADGLDRGLYSIRGQAPETSDVQGRVRTLLKHLAASPLPIARAPNVQ